MRTRAPTLFLASLVLASCSGGPGGPPSLAYVVPPAAEADYVVGDTVTIALQGLGQPLEIAARSAARYGVRFEPVGGGVRVTASLEDLAADVVMPMAEPVAMDESALEGDFVFEIDGRGRASSMTSPQAAALGGQVFAAPLVAHALLPRLPGRTAGVGDSWVDSVTYREVAEAGETEVTSTLSYTVVGEGDVEGRAVLDIEFGGPAVVTQNLSLEGATIRQSSELDVTGRLRWDLGTGLLYENEMTMEGEGSVRVAVLPAALPTRVRWHTRVRRQDR